MKWGWLKGYGHYMQTFYNPEQTILTHVIFIMTCQCSVQNGSTMLKTISSKLCPLHGDSCSLFKSLKYIISIVITTFEYPSIFKKVYFDWSHLICQWIFIYSMVPLIMDAHSPCWPWLLLNVGQVWLQYYMALNLMAHGYVAVNMPRILMVARASSNIILIQ